jgi:flavocytochrome c
MTTQPTQVIVLGGGLSGLSAAHTALEAGHYVTLIDKCAFMGGNSTKATSGINGGGTRVQAAMGIPDSKEQFEEDTIRGGTGKYKGPMPKGWPLARVISHTSADSIHWLIDSFDLKLDTVSRLGGHTYQRTHRRKAGGKFPGFMITYALMQKYEAIMEATPERARFINRARANKLIQNANGDVIGVEYAKGGVQHREMGVVVIATGGYAAGGLEADSFLSKVRPDLMHYPTTNGEHCTGDGIQLAVDAGGKGVGLNDVQIHPTGLWNPQFPDARVLFLAAEALRGEGGIILDKDGKRFCNDLGTRDYVTGCMNKHNNGPYRLVLNETAIAGIAWHVSHYEHRGVMKPYASGADLAAEMKIPVSQLAASFDDYNSRAANKNDTWEKKFFPAVPFNVNQKFSVGIVTPVAHYTMGGVYMDDNARCLRDNDSVIDGLYVCGEAAGGIHGINRLGGSGLLEAVVFGRLAGASAAARLGDPTLLTRTAHAAQAVEVSASSSGEQKEYTMAEVAKHTSESDCWVVIDNQVLDVTNFLADHPGGKMAIMNFAGRDATEPFDMVHEEGVIEKFASECVIGTIKLAAAL